MTVVITGGAGYIGSQLIRDMASHPEFQGRTIRIFDNMFKERHCSLWDLDSKNANANANANVNVNANATVNTNVKYEMFEGDVRNKENVKAALKDAEIVISMADITNAPLSFEREQLTRETNYEGALNVFNEAQKTASRFIYASSASLYGPTAKIVDESYECKPISPYGKYKLMAETEMMKKSEETSFGFTSLRQGTVYGWSIGMRFDTVIDRFVYLACIGSPMTVWETAINEKRPYLHVKDASRAFMWASTTDSTRQKILNAVSGNLSLKQVIDEIKNHIPDAEVKMVPTPNLNQVSYVLDSSRIKSLGFDFKYGLDDGIAGLIDKFRIFHGKKTHQSHNSKSP